MDPQLDRAPCGFVSFDDAGTILLANATLAEWLGRPPGSLAGMSMDALYAPGGAIFHQTHFFPLLKLQGEAREIHLSLRTLDGVALPVLANAVRRDAAEGAHSDCVLVPVPKRHQYEQQLLRARASAEATRDAKARFLSMMAHEIRTPLSAIIGLAHVLLQDLHGPIAVEQREDLELMRSAGMDIDRLISEILRYSRAESGQDPAALQDVSVDDALTAVESIMRPRWQDEDLHYQRRFAPSNMSVRADPIRLHQILLNLLANAANHTPAGGQVSVDAITDDAAGRLRIEVQDSGCGIAEDQLARIFEPFVQIGRAQRPAGKRGTGLGLAISREFATSMQGTLEARSTQGEGSVFLLTLLLAS